MTGLFITLEGGEGCGKSTQIQLLKTAIENLGKACVVTREPGGSPGAEAIRELLLKGSADKWYPIPETLLFLAARLEHVERVIKPALSKDAFVLCDRFMDSTLVYQGISKGLGVEYVRNLHRMTIGDFKPDLTLILDIDPAIGLKRASARAGNETRFENMDASFHQAVRAGFLDIAKNEPGRCEVIDASGSIENVHAKMMQAVSKRLK